VVSSECPELPLPIASANHCVHACMERLRRHAGVHGLFLNFWNKFLFDPVSSLVRARKAFILIMHNIMHGEIKMGKKARTTLYIDTEIVKEARELGLNISKTCEIALKQAIEQLGALYNKNKPKDCSESTFGGAARIRTGVPSARGSEPRPC
jgi:hypothetical protein